MFQSVRILDSPTATALGVPGQKCQDACKNKAIVVELKDMPAPPAQLAGAGELEFGSCSARCTL